ncbi:MAG: 50S ribosomal protein L29 [Micavibrio sp.]
MKAEDLKGKTRDELQKALMDARKEQFNARLQRAAGQLENTATVRNIRRNIARIKTFININAETPAAKAPAKKKAAKA